jgi:methylated-DNA-[protein]-cysteine S-methyltransferase
MKIVVTKMDTPVGTLQLAERDGKLVALKLASFDRPFERAMKRFPDAEIVEGDGTSEASTKLRRYFDGDIGALDEIDVDPGGTPFQAAVWEALRKIPAGKTLAYSEVAAMAGAEHAVRAAGTAVGSNPVGIVIPCHRVIHLNGDISGYGGGDEMKRWLLQHEGVIVPQPALVSS